MLRHVLRPAVALMALVGMVAVACGGDDGPTTTSTTIPDSVPTAAALAATIEALHAELDAEGLGRKVIVAPRYDGAGFSLEVQADVVGTLAGVIDVQFIDDATQALIDDGTAVVDDAILLRLALADVPGPIATLSGEHWRSIDEIAQFTATVRDEGDGYVATVEFD